VFPAERVSTLRRHRGCARSRTSRQSADVDIGIGLHNLQARMPFTGPVYLTRQSSRLRTSWHKAQEDPASVWFISILCPFTLYTSASYAPHTRPGLEEESRAGTRAQRRSNGRNLKCTEINNIHTYKQFVLREVLGTINTYAVNEPNTPPPSSCCKTPCLVLSCAPNPLLRAVRPCSAIPPSDEPAQDHMTSNSQC